MRLDDFATVCRTGRRRPSAVALNRCGVDGELVYAEPFDVAARRPATTDPACLLTSITKPMMATAICRFVDTGQLTLELAEVLVISRESSEYPWVGDPWQA